MRNNYYSIILFTVFLLLGFTVFSQNLITEKKRQPTLATYSYKRPLNCALNTANLIADYKENKEQLLLKKNNLIKKNNELYVGAFLKVNTNFNKNDVTVLDVQLNSQVGNYYTARIPLKNIEKLLLINGIENVEIAEKAEMQLNNTLSSTNASAVHSGLGLSKAYSGNGVVVGIIDGGFDYTHPTFYNQTHSQYRISRVWEQNETITPPIDFSYGNEIIGQTNILSNGFDSTNNSHGTHVAGIAAGSGGMLNSSYKGLAHESDIVLVSTDLSSNVNFLDGIEYIFDYAASVNKPVVVNMSLGSHFGPHDGTSTFDKMCDGLVGPGRILVGAAGNEGIDKIHINKTLSAGNNLFSFLAFPNSAVNYAKGETKIDIWGEVGQNFEVAVNVYNIITKQFESNTPYINTLNSADYNGTIYDNDTSSSPDGCQVQILTESLNVNNNKPHAIIVIDNSLQDDDSRYVLLEVKSAKGSINAWNFGDGKGIFSNLTELNINVGADDGNTNLTVGEIGGTGNSIISVGAYTSKNSYTAYNGSNQIISSPGTIGSIASFSSKGPTVDGRIKPDITAPGNVIVSSVNHFDTINNFNETNTETVSGLTDGTTKWWFATMQGTSMASPVVTGIVALWLQAHPALTIDDIKSLLKVSSITDSFTGNVPNNTWGNGKIDALYGMKLIEQYLNLDEINTNSNLVVYPNPTTSKIFISSTKVIDTLEVFNMLGQKVHSDKLNSSLENKELDLSIFPNGIYLLKFNNNGKTKTVKVVKQ